MNQDFATIGKQIKAKSGAYQDLPDEVVGQAYLKKTNPLQYEIYKSQSEAPAQAAKKISDEAISNQSSLELNNAKLKQEYDFKQAHPEKTTGDIALEKKNKDLSSAASNYLNAYQQYVDKGDLTSKEAKQELSFMAAKYNSVAGFGEGGKTLTGSELGILAPTLIKTQRQRDKNLIEKMLGTNPPLTTGSLDEDPSSAAEKMKLALKYTNPDLYSKYQNIKTDQPTQDQSTQGYQPGRETLNPNFAQNVGGNVQRMLQGLPGFAKSIYEMTPAANAIDSLQGKQIDPARPYKTVLGIGAGMVTDAGKMVGVNKTDKGLEFDPRQGLTHIYNNPVDAAMWLLPFLKGGKALKGAAGAEVPTKAIQVAEGAGKLTEAERAAVGVAKIVPTSSIKSADLMGKAFQYTSKGNNSLDGISIQLEKSIPIQGEVINKWAKVKDASMGPQPLGEVVDQVMQKVADSTPAKANPELLSIIETDLKREMSIGQLDGGMSRGQFEATNFEAINKTRKYMSSGLDKWFEQGQPVGNKTNNLNAMKWDVASIIKDIFSEADTEGVVKNALDRQHVAFEVFPRLSKMSSLKGPGLSSTSLKWGILRKVWEKTGGRYIESSGIDKARSLQPEAPNPQTMIDSILQRGQIPGQTVQSPPMPQSQPLPPAQNARPFPLPDEIISSVLKGKGPAQSSRLVRDMRSTKNPRFIEGGSSPRSIQDYLIRMSKKKKYK